VLIDKVAGAVVEVLDVRGIGERIGWMLHAVQALRIEALPPPSLAVRTG
jgi:hypothetical protein